MTVREVELWDSGNVETQLLAALIIKPTSLSAHELDMIKHAAHRKRAITIGANIGLYRATGRCRRAARRRTCR